MKITIEPTTQLLTLDGVPVRLWEGTTEQGTRCHLFISRVAVSKEEPPEAQAVFERELEEQRAPTVAFPSRLVL